ncbi:MAG: hypothetical protein PF689_05195 [Deltaproteobacteria bacterium]|jgi:hypothetical protein|nr:hypothetical protein [Deltaproteobacteria bacterium]
MKLFNTFFIILISLAVFACSNKNKDQEKPVSATDKTDNNGKYAPNKAKDNKTKEDKNITKPSEPKKKVNLKKPDRDHRPKIHSLGKISQKTIKLIKKVSTQEIDKIKWLTASFDFDNFAVTTGQAPFEMTIYNVSKGSKTGTNNKVYGPPVFNLTKGIVAVNKGKTIEIINPDSGEVLKKLGDSDNHESKENSNDTSNDKQEKVQVGNLAFFNQLAWSPQGKYLAACQNNISGANRKIIIWKSADWKLLNTRDINLAVDGGFKLGFFDPKVTGLFTINAFTSSLLQFSQFKVENGSDEEASISFKLDCKNCIDELVIKPNHLIVLAGNENKNFLAVFDKYSGKKLATHEFAKENKDDVLCNINQAGSKILTGQCKRIVTGKDKFDNDLVKYKPYRFFLINGIKSDTREVHKVENMALHPDGKHYAIKRDNQIFLYKFGEKKPLANIKSNAVLSIGFSKSGKKLWLVTQKNINIYSLI